MQRKVLVFSSTPKHFPLFQIWGRIRCFILRSVSVFCLLPSSSSLCRLHIREEGNQQQSSTCVPESLQISSNVCSRSICPEGPWSSSHCSSQVVSRWLSLWGVGPPGSSWCLRMCLPSLSHLGQCDEEHVNNGPMSNGSKCWTTTQAEGLGSQTGS